jgi:hypothetical protein
LDYNAKLSKLFPNIQCVERGIEELDLSVRIYNILKRCEIHTLQDLLNYSCNELIEHKSAKGKDGVAESIIYHLDWLNKGKEIAPERVDREKYMKKKTTRGINDEFVKAFIASGLYTKLFAANKKDLFLGIRNEYINLYYKAASVCNVRYNNLTRKLSCKIHKLYMLGKGDYGSNPYITVTPSEIINNYDKIKGSIDSNNAKNRHEKEAQQELVYLNNSSEKSNWICIDIEYVKQLNNSDETSFGRFDIVAISKKTPHRVALIELKYGAGAIGGNSGILKHLQDFKKFNEENVFEKHLKKEIFDVTNSLYMLNACPIMIKDESDIKSQPEFYFITLNNNAPTPESSTPKMTMAGYLFKERNPKYKAAGARRQSAKAVETKLGDITDPENESLYAQFLFSEDVIGKISIVDIIDDSSYERNFTKVQLANI